MTSQMLARASFSAICLTVFPFEFRPRTFTIGFYGKKSFISELMILKCSFPLIKYRYPNPDPDPKTNEDPKVTSEVTSENLFER